MTVTTDDKKSRWHTMTEEEKLRYALGIALQRCQESYFIFTEHFPETAKEYIQFQKDIIDWLAPKTGDVGLPMYEGEGICGTVQYLKQHYTGDDHVNNECSTKERT